MTLHKPDSVTCRVCGGDGWVCENHPDRPAFGDCCGGAGAPCGACALPLAAAWLIQRERDVIALVKRDCLEAIQRLQAYGDTEEGVVDTIRVLNEAVERMAARLASTPRDERIRAGLDALGMEARSVETEGLHPKDDSPTAEGGDAQNHQDH